MQTAIIGGGNFGTAIANIIAANGHPTYLWMRDAQQAEEVERLRENRRICRAILWPRALFPPQT